MAKTRPGVASKIKPGRKELDSYTIKGTNKVVRGSLYIILYYRHLSNLDILLHVFGHLSVEIRFIKEGIA